MSDNLITAIKSRLANANMGPTVLTPAEPPPLPHVKTEWRYLQERDLSGLKSLLFEARAIVQGYYAGRHRSPFKGSAPEFSDYRQYNPGDELRTVDWRVFARSDRYFVRRYEQETNLACTILLDASASMGYRGLGPRGGARRVAPSKFDYAARLSGALAFLMLKQGDSVGLTLFDKSIRGHVPPAGRYPHLFKVLRMLEETKPGKTTSLATALRKAHALVRRRGLLVVISDLHDDPDEIVKALGLFTHRGFEVLLFHLMHEDEVDLPQIGAAEFVDSETGVALTCNPDDLRDGYRRAITEVREDWRRRARARGIDYQFISTDVPYAKALGQYLIRRDKV